jgi:subtilisin-like proprotein convertase family protein
MKPCKRLGCSHSSRPRHARGCLWLEYLEDRTQPSVNVITTTPGVAFSTASSGAEPPDPIVAAGPSQVVEMVNSDLRVCDPSGSILATQSLVDVFAPLEPGDNLSDPSVVYDQQANRFAIAVLDVDVETMTDDLLFAVSNDSTATGGFTEQQRISFTSSFDFGAFADYPRVGWNNDAYVYTLNMFDSSLTFDHVDVVTISKASVLDQNPTTFQDSVADVGSDYSTLTPAVMHGDPNSTPNTGDDPMWLVSATASGEGNTMDVVEETRTLSGSPSFKQNWVTVSPYINPPAAAQPGGTMATNDSRVLNAEWQNDLLVADHTIGITGGSTALARWYQFSTAGATPTLVQQGNLNRGTGVSTYMPAIAIAPNGSLGMTFMESSDTENASMYVTGQIPGAKAGVMQSPALVAAGSTFYSGSRSGDFSGITADPSGDNSFWAASEYVTPDTLWGTAIAHFNLLKPAGPRVLRSTPVGTVAGPVLALTFTFSTYMDPSSFSTASIDSFTGPGGSNLLSQIRSYGWTDRTHLKVYFWAQSAVGSYTMAIGPNILDTFGHAMDQNGNGTRGEVPADEYQGTFAIAVPQIFTDSNKAKINSSDVTYSNMTIDKSLIIGSATLQLNITYPTTDDLLIDLISPNGTDVTLAEFEGTGANFQNTVFSDTASVPIGAGTNPFKGSYQPEIPLSALAGQSTAGTWTLQVGNFGGLTGMLNSWSLIVLGQDSGGKLDDPAAAAGAGDAPTTEQVSGNEAPTAPSASDHHTAVASVTSGSGHLAALFLPLSSGATASTDSLTPPRTALVQQGPRLPTLAPVFADLPVVADQGDRRPLVLGAVTELRELVLAIPAKLESVAAPDGTPPPDAPPEPIRYRGPRLDTAFPAVRASAVPLPAARPILSDAFVANVHEHMDLASAVLLVLALGGAESRVRVGPVAGLPRSVIMPG